MNVLITGATGFAGSHLADYLISSEHLKVHGLRRPRSRDEFTNPAVTYHEGDITDLSSLISILAKVKPNYIFHLAAQSFVPLSWQAPQATIATNVIGTLNLLEAVRQTCPTAKVQIAGSSEEYGQVYSDECPITEDQPLRPQSPYGVSKVATDLLGRQYYKSYGLNIIVTRAFNHTGPRRGEQFVESKIAHELAKMAIGKIAPVLKLGNLDAVRDFTDVRDMVAAYWSAINYCIPGIPYNIGTGEGHSINTIVNMLCKIAGITPQVVQDEAFTRPSDVPLLIADNSLFRATTRWTPKIPLEQTLLDLYDYWSRKEKK